MTVFDPKIQQQVVLDISESYDILYDIKNIPRSASKSNNELANSQDKEKLIFKHIENIENGEYSFIKD